MHEILHFQLGPRSNHVGTHSWNIRESLFAYTDQDVDHGVAHDVDWRQGLGRQNEETYMPRLIACDLKENFGALPNINALYGTTDGDEDEDGLTDGPAEKLQRLQTAPPIPPSAYQTFLESDQPDPTYETDNDDEADNDNDDKLPQPPRLTETRFWSDFNRVYYHPRTLHPLPPQFLGSSAVSASVSGFTSWETGSLAWSAVKTDSHMEDDFRLFAEEADLLQGVQLCVDMSTGFGPIGAGVVEEFIKEEYPKGDVFVTGLMGSLEGLEESNSITRIFTEAQTLVSLLQADTTLLPVQPPSPEWLPALSSPPNLFQSSALVASHLVSVLMPLRLKTDRLGMASLRQGLNWRGDTRLCELSGRAALWDVELAKKQCGIDFSSVGGLAGSTTTPFFSQSVLRGIPEQDASGLFDSLQQKTGLKGPLFTTRTAPERLPLASPFPSTIFSPEPSSSNQTSPKSIPIWSTLSSSTNSRHLLNSFTQSIGSFLSVRGDMRLAFGGGASLGGSGGGDWGRDEGRELLEALWSVREGFMEDDEGEESDGERE
ncbi:Members of tubulin/FtsZ family [Phaffia rhodozyma]|uniref:Members of tubulin/FtsZ family n=1 Tax=Phaffia rhodozyma TaxID=264483 RepID=A0A0F7SYK4_PHARH|nr:Members of tubulin/FtsZ family [Phaffia rhodozyma]